MGSVGDLPIADLDHDGFDESRCVNLVEGPVLPGIHLLDDLVGKPRDHLPGTLGPVHSWKWELILAGWAGYTLISTVPALDGAAPDAEQIGSRRSARLVSISTAQGL